MKKYMGIAVLLCLILVLSGCGGCKHEWVEADCLTAKTCTLCREVEGESLGHDWQEAACETPKTCARCTLTEGAAPGHSYGKWEMAENEMKRACEVCGSQETVEPDYDVYLQQEMQGHWDFVLANMGGQVYSGMHMNADVVLSYIDSAEDKLTYYDMQKVYECTWAYDDKNGRTENENGVQYWILASAEGEPVTSIAFVDAANGEDYLAVPMGDNMSIAMSQNQKAVTVLEGSWVASDEGKGYSLNIRRDGTFTGNLDGEISGDWHLRAVGAFYGGSTNSGVMNLRYQKDGQEVLKTVNIHFGSTSSDWSTYRDTATLFISGKNANFSWIEESKIPEWEAALAEGPGKLTGEWIIVEDRIYNYDTRQETATAAKDALVTFREDGTFTARLGEENFEGTWYFDNVNVSDYSTSYSYQWKYKESDSTLYHISMYSENDITMTMPGKDRESRSLSCMRNTAENKEALAEAAVLPLGKWISISVDQWNATTGTSTNRATTEYSVEIFEDGTFTANLDQQIRGRWRFTQLDEYETGKAYNYSCTLELTDDSDMRFSIVQGGTLDLSYYTEEDSYSFRFTQMDETEKAALEAEMEKARLLPVGTWVSHTYTRWNSTTQQGSDEPHSGYTLTFSADGTLTGTLEQPINTTWQLSDVYHGDGYTVYNYSFVHDLPENWSISCGEDYLNLNYYKDGISHSIFFEKQ